MTDIQELALTESRSLRARYADRVDVLDRVRILAMAGDSGYALTEQVANYFSVTSGAIEQLVKRNRVELEERGYRSLTGAALRELKDKYTDVPMSRAARVAAFTRPAVLNLAMLMEGNEVAKEVRTYLLAVEEIAGPEVRNEAIERAAVSRAQLAMLKVAESMTSADQGWVAAKTKVVISRGLGEEPEISPLAVPLYVPDYLKGKGLTAQQVGSEQSWFGKRVVMVCEEDGFEPPAKRPNLLPNGQIRETRAWVKRHLPYFEEAWDRWYADKYDSPTQLNLVSGD